MSQPITENLPEEQNGKKEKKARKRGQGEGSVYKRKDGRWAAVANLGYQAGKLKRKYYYGETRKEACDKLTAALNDLQKGVPIVTERQTLKEFLERWMTDCVTPSVRPSTLVSYDYQIRLHIAPQLGRIELTKLSPQQIQTYLNGRLKAGLSPRTVKYHLSILRMAIGQALRWNLVARNVAMLVDPPRIEKFEVQPITPEQARAFLQAVQGDHLEALFTVALSLGLRRGEALGLRWSDIDFQTRTLQVRQSLQRLQGELQITELKTKSSRRNLDLPEILVNKLREHRTRQLEHKMQAGPNWQETGLVFTSRIGTPVDPRHVKRRLDPLLKQAGLPHFRVHDLRHFCASLLLAQGVPLKVVSEILGHSKIGITADLYTHVLPSVRKEAINLMDSILTATN